MKPMNSNGPTKRDQGPSGIIVPPTSELLK